MNDKTKIDKDEYRKKFAQIWYKSRTRAGFSQEYMAHELGVSRKTIQNWEKGNTSPDLFQTTEWFRTLGLNPLTYYIEYLYPKSNDPDKNEDEQITEQLMHMIREASSFENRELLFLMSGEHGSSWYALLQMMTAHCHTVLKDRIVVAKMIKDCYLLDKAIGIEVCPDEIQPDIQVLKAAYKEATLSILQNKKEYTIQ